MAVQPLAFSFERSNSGSMMALRRLLSIVSLIAKVLAVSVCAWLSLTPAQAVTYANASIPLAWIDPISGGHTRVGYNTGTYFFSNTGSCGTSGTTLDDTLSNQITLGFDFWFGGVSYSSVRISTNGRLQFNNTTCGAGTQNIGPPQTYPYVYPSTGMNQTMKIFGADLDPTDLVDNSNYPSAAAKTNCQRTSTGCGIYIATLGNAPYRKFVVTWYNVPEWVNYTNTSGSFTMQAILHENGEFVFQYLNLNHGGTGTAEVGWQIDSQDYDVLQFANGTEPDQNTAIKFYIPQPLAEYRMEQGSWPSGASVLDTSGNERHASTFSAGTAGLPTVTSSGKVCRGASIPANTSADNISALVTPFDLQTVGSQGTVTFWYRHIDNSTPRMLLDASGVSASIGASRWFYVMKTASRQLKFVVYDNAGARYEAITASNTLSASGGWDHIGVSWSLNGKPGSNQDRLLLWINGSLVRTQSFTTSQPISTALTTLYIGDNRSVLGVEDNSGNASASGARGTGNSAASTIDEVRIYNFEGGKGLVDRDRLQASACVGHYQIEHGGTGTICQATPITIRSHSAAHANVLMPNNTTTIRLSTSTGEGDWSLLNGYGTLVNGTANDGVATYLFNGEYQIELALSHPSPGMVNINVTDGQLQEDSDEDDKLIVHPCNKVAGFNACDVFPAEDTARCTPTAADTGYNYARLKTKLAGDYFVLNLLALKSNGELDSSFKEPVQVDLLANTLYSPTNFNSSTRCPNTQTAVIPLGTVTFGQDYPGGVPADTPPVVPVAGDNGYSRVTVKAARIKAVAPGYEAYQDLRLRFTCSSTYCPPNGIVQCSSDNFAIRPKDVTIEPIAPLVTNQNSYAGSSGYKQVAGSRFSLKATAVPGYSGLLLFNKDQSGPLPGGKIISCWGSAAGCPAAQVSSALRSATGGSDPVYSFNTASATTGSTGSSVFFYHEVGTFLFDPGAVYDKTFTAADGATDCIENSWSNAADLSSGKVGCWVANQNQAGPFGRFYPDRFEYKSGAVTQGTDGFSYFGRSDFNLSYRIAAYSSGAETASQMTTRYNAITPELVAVNGTAIENLLVVSGGATEPRISWNKDASGGTGWGAGAGTWAGGAYDFSSGNTLKRPAAPENNGPYDDLYFAVNALDPDGARLGALDFKLGTPSCTGVSCTHKKINSNKAIIRFGRLRLSNVYGSVSPLLMPVEAQYWSGRSWVKNTKDAASLSTVVLSYDSAGWALPALPTLDAGVAFLTINPVSVGVRTVTANLAAMPWLQGNWNGAAAYDQNPSAVASFGVYGTPQAQRVIHVRELF